MLVYDGDCRFCTLWVRRWQQITGERVEYVALQTAEVAVRLPELSRQELEAAVHLIEPDGVVCTGAEAVFRALAKNPRELWLQDWYEHSPGFACAAEWVYGFVARHRTFFSSLARLGWGAQPQPTAYQTVRWVFLRVLALIYLIAFLSLAVQVTGLLGEDGIVPARLTMDSVQQQATAAHLGWDKFHLFPTLCWFSASDGFLKSQCIAGALVSVLLLLDVAPAVCLAVLWVIYLSLTVIGREFLGFQWDALLLETGFLALFVAEWGRLAPRFPWRGTTAGGRPIFVGVWLLRWLLFRLMFASGCVKLVSGDPTWRHMTALRFHYETQPLPTWIGWYVHQLPGGFQRGSTEVMFGIELVLPFFIFGPRRVRQVCCAAFLFLQLLILLTGNYCFFNLLTIALCLLLLDDAALASLWQRVRLLGRGKPASLAGHEERVSLSPPQLASPKPGRARVATLMTRAQRLLLIPVSFAFVMIPLIDFAGMFGWRFPFPGPVASAYSWLAPFRTCNHYGLFAVMTTNRLEIVVEGSNDGVTWRAYEFKYKPGDVKGRPGFVEPHQPRLDWQMWFAALGDYRGNAWFVNFCVRLLENRAEVVRLLEHNPFPDAPPRYVRAITYEYHFTDWGTRRRTGAWWTRELRGQYLPPISLRHG